MGSLSTELKNCTNYQSMEGSKHKIQYADNFDCRWSIGLSWKANKVLLRKRDASDCFGLTSRCSDTHAQRRALTQNPIGRSVSWCAACGTWPSCQSRPGGATWDPTWSWRREYRHRPSQPVGKRRPIKGSQWVISLGLENCWVGKILVKYCKQTGLYSHTCMPTHTQLS